MTKQFAVLETKTRIDQMNTGLDAEYRSEMAETLTDILSDTYRLTIKSHVYHWNVVGPLFKPLHELTEEHYNDLFEAADVIAERIRAIGHLAPERLAQATKFAPPSTSMSDLTAEAMVADLVEDHEFAVRAMREAGVKADENRDLVTADMLTARLTFHEKALWMLRAHLAD
ncbi:MAG: DNA starvation/stationary phase protection protein [Pseudomonadota bacterium]|nr:DNA starvation/stationary phase protection protein [Pseudomonadota bacterium]